MKTHEHTIEKKIESDFMSDFSTSSSNVDLYSQRCLLSQKLLYEVIYPPEGKLENISLICFCFMDG